MTEESFLHCIGDCALPRESWKKLGMEDSPFFSIQDFHNWLRMALTGSNNPLILAGIWFALCARNATCIGKEQVQLYKVILDVQSLTSILCLNKQV